MNIIQQRVNGVERVWPGMIWAAHVSTWLISWVFRALCISQNLLLGLLDTQSSRFSALTRGESLCSVLQGQTVAVTYKAKCSPMNDAAHYCFLWPGNIMASISNSLNRVTFKNNLYLCQWLSRWNLSSEVNWTFSPQHKSGKTEKSKE